MHQAFDAPPDTAFVLGLLADLERNTRTLEVELLHAQAQARPHNAAFDEAREQWLGQNEQLRTLQVTGNQAARALADANAQAATLLQEIGNLNRKSEDIRLRMQALAADSEDYRRQRRARAAIGVQIEDRQKELAKHQSASQAERGKLEAAHKASLAEGDAARATRANLKTLQALQPPASLHLDLFAQRASQAHAHVTLEAHDMVALRPNLRPGQSARLGPPPSALASKEAWKQRMLTASAHITGLYQGLEAGRYAIEGAASWAGGRSVAVSESLYAMVALGELEGAIDLFSLSSAKDGFFHHIFQTFRGGCLGLFLVGRHSELAEALRLHQDAQGIRGAYVQAYSALLYGDEAMFHDALMAITVAEWRQWRMTPTPGLGLVNVTVLGLAELSRLRGFAMPAQFGPTIPWILQPQ